MAPDRIHVFGASGSGTSTLGRALAARAGHVVFDADDFYWLQSDPPYQFKRETRDRQTLLSAELERRARWVLSGSVTGWGDPFLPLFDAIVFLDVPTSIRLERLARREASRYGADRIGPGGDLEARHAAFLAWAGAYETGVPEGRCRRKHEAWLRALPSSCRLLRLDGTRPVDELVDVVLGVPPGTERVPPAPPSPLGR